MIVVCGVHFMGETAKFLNPSETVVVPDLRAGLFARRVDHAADVRALRERYPGVPVVTYVNTSAAVKAESDICCTTSTRCRSSSALDAPRVILLPDAFLANYVASQHRGRDHRLAGPLRSARAFQRRRRPAVSRRRSDAIVLAHPECPPDVLAAADFAGSTQGDDRLCRRLSDHQAARACSS